MRPIVAVLLLLLGSSGCAGGSGGPGESILLDRSVSVAAGSSEAFDVWSPTGRIDVTADWSGAGDIDLYLVEASCSGVEALVLGQCLVLARIDDADPDSAAIPATSVTQGNYQLFALAVGEDGRVYVHVRGRSRH